MPIKVKETFKFALKGHNVVTFDAGIRDEMPQEALDFAIENDLVEIIEEKVMKKAPENKDKGDKKDKKDKK